VVDYSGEEKQEEQKVTFLISMIVQNLYVEKNLSFPCDRLCTLIFESSIESRAVLLDLTTWKVLKSHIHGHHSFPAAGAIAEAV